MSRQRLQITVRGAVQGVGFRPFVHRVASELELGGWVRNSGAGVVCEVEGEQAAEFPRRLRVGLPVNAVIDAVEVIRVAPSGERDFRIRDSDTDGIAEASILPDLATCSECLEEILDPSNRRHRYPFSNCTHCGPRFSIIERIPYDRANTAMRGFRMCPECEAEYEDPSNRRFHAQPNACPVCGPQLQLIDEAGNSIAGPDQAIAAAVIALRDGQVVAVKGIGGFHLMVDALNVTAVRRLRKRKRRGNKPFAVMYPATVGVARDCELSDIERESLESPVAPIVLLQRKPGALIPEAVAPRNPYVGVVLPYSPLHHLLLDAIGGPVVATSGNLSEEPICFSNEDALADLAGIADVFLLHDRPIVRPVDDSIVREVAGRMMVLRRSRGYAPLPIGMDDAPDGILAMGADLKNTVAWSRNGKVFVSQHLGDLGTERSLNTHVDMCRDLPALYPGDVTSVVHDLHPDYLSTKQVQDLESIGVQHHHAHVAACRAEHGIAGSCLGVAFDGTGCGTDGTIWGGEFLLVDESGFERCNWLRTFPLPGGEKAIRDPRFTAYGMLHEARLVDEGIDFLKLAEAERSVVQSMLKAGVNCPRTSSVGRLFDSVSALLGLCERNTYEGEAAMALEFVSTEVPSSIYPVESESPINWAPMLLAILDDLNSGNAIEAIAGRFHGWLVEVIAQVAVAMGQKTVVLAGGCFQNRLLLEAANQRLRVDGFKVYWPQRIPPNDGGIALGQVAVAAKRRT